MKLLVVNNLASGPGDGAIYDFIRSFSNDGDEICIRSTNGTTDIAELIHDASAFDAVVSSGGDGTTAVISYLLANSGIPILPFPAGTANLLALNLDSPLEPHALANVVRDGRTLDFDMAEMEVEGKRFGFCIMAGAGYDATIMREAEPSKRWLGQTAYFSAAVLNALPQKSHFTIQLDDRTIESEGIGVLVVNFAKMQFDLTVCPENAPRDNMLDIVILKVQNAFELLPSVFATILDVDENFNIRSDVLDIHRAHTVHVEADPPLEMQYDGEPTTFMTPFTARVMPNAVRYFVSKEGYDLFSD